MNSSLPETVYISDQSELEFGSLTASWERILEVSNSSAHFLEFDRPAQRRTGASAGRFLCGALKEGGVAVAIATPRSTTGIMAQLARMGRDPVTAMQNGEFVLLESSETLSRFFHNRAVDAEEFDRTVGAAMRTAHERANGRPLRAFGDMVGVLWQRGDRHAAVELERLWNSLQKRLGFALFCTYPVDVFGEEFCAENLEGVFESHSHIFPSASSADLGRVLDRAMDEVLGPQARDVRSRISARTGDSLPPMPKAEQMILGLRTHLPDIAGTVLNRARELYEIGSPRVYLRQEHSSA